MSPKVRKTCDKKHAGAAVDSTGGTASHDGGAHLVSLRRGSYVSKSALAQVLKDVRENGVPAASSRPSQLRARKKAILEDTPLYGPCVIDYDLQQIEKGKRTTRKIALQCPFAFLWKSSKDCARFRQLLRDSFMRFPCTADQPWNLVLYFDAVSPSNPLNSGKDTRNTECVYWSFMELLDVPAENTWFTAAACREIITSKLPGAMSEFIALVMKQFFKPPGAAHDFARTGVTVDVGEGGNTVLRRLYAVHTATIADAKAHSEILGHNGYTAMKCCPGCRSIIVPNQAEVRLEGHGLVPYTSTNPDDWNQRTDDQMRRLAQKLMTLHAEADNDALRANLKDCFYSVSFI